MSGNLDPDRGSGGSNNVNNCGGGTGGQLPGAGKIFPMDLAVTPQKITIVKSAGTAGDNKLHLVTPQGKPHLLSHSGPISLVRPAPQIISQGVANQQPQMMVSGTQLVPESHVNQTSQIINQSQIIGSNSQLLSPQTIISQNNQIISQGNQIISHGSQISQGGHIGQGTHIITPGSQLMGQGNQIISQAISHSQVISQTGSVGTQVLNVGGPIVGGGGVVVSSSGAIRSMSTNMRVFTPSTLSSPRSAASTVTVSQLNAALSGKPPPGVSSHVPRGLAAGASLAVPRAIARPVTPTTPTLNVSTISGWNNRASVRGPALVYPARASPRPAPRPSPPISIAAPASIPVVLPVNANQQSGTITTAIVTSSGVISPVPRLSTSRATLRPAGSLVSLAPARPLQPRPAHQRPTQIPVLQTNIQHTKVVAVGAPAQNQRSALYYEVTKTTVVTSHHTPFTYSHAHSNFVQHNLPAVSMTVVPITTASDSRLASPPPAPAPAAAAPTVASVLARPSILRKRDVDGSPIKNVTSTAYSLEWPRDASERLKDEAGGEADAEGEGDGGSTTVSAASSPGPDDEPPSPPRPVTPLHDISPRKKPRKQMFNSEVRECDLQNDEPPPSPPPPVPPPPRRSLLGSSWLSGYRATALHFTRPSEVRRKETKPPHVLELANQKHVLTKANGWKVHHLTAQMDDLVELESASCEQLGEMLRAFDAARAPHLNPIMELVKGNIQRSKIVCEDMREARADILRVFTHRTFVADILARQADKRCFRKHRNNHT